MRAFLCLVVTLMLVGCSAMHHAAEYGKSDTGSPKDPLVGEYVPRTKSNATLSLKDDRTFTFKIGPDTGTGTWDKTGKGVLLTFKLINGMDVSEVMSGVASGKVSQSAGTLAQYFEATLGGDGALSFAAPKDAFGNPIPDGDIILAKN